jgi:hypothetical protein
MALKSQGLAALASRLVTAAALAGGAAMLAACSTAGTIGGAIGDHMPAATGGLPESAPQRPAMPAAYPAVHEMPPPRSSTVLTDAEQKKLEDDLVAARNRAAATTAKPAGGAGSP